MTSRSPASIALYTTGAILTGLVGYAVYFDYMRRNSPEFRKNLKKQQKKLQLEADAQEKKQKEKNMKALRAAAIEVQNENPPSSPEAQEAYFQEHVAEGERIQAAGPDSYVEAATHFYRALRVYPQPVELLMIYQKVCPEPVFKLIIELTQLTATAAGPSGGMGGMGGMGGPGAAANLTAPPRAEASVADIDDSAAGIEVDEKEGTDSDNGASSATSAEGWDKLADEASKA